VLRDLGRLIRPGVTTKELDRAAERMIRDAGALPTFLGYRGYPASVCLSINEEVVHGIPSDRRQVREGDIVSVDLGATFQGFVGDTAATFMAGNVSEEDRRLVETTRRCLERAIDKMRAGNRLGDVSSAVQACAEAEGYGVVRDYVGHGIGRAMHEEPAVPNHGEAGTGLRLDAGLVLALEPMINAGTWKVKTLPDGWTVVTQDGRRSAHFEHTVAVTEGGPEILTAVSEHE
jgi:methionyl aminopeptidase